MLIISSDPILGVEPLESVTWPMLGGPRLNVLGISVCVIDWSRIVAKILRHVMIFYVLEVVELYLFCNWCGWNSRFLVRNWYVQLGLVCWFCRGGCTSDSCWKSRLCRSPTSRSIVRYFFYDNRRLVVLCTRRRPPATRSRCLSSSGVITSTVTAAAAFTITASAITVLGAIGVATLSALVVSTLAFAGSFARAFGSFGSVGRSARPGAAGFRS